MCSAQEGKFVRMSRTLLPALVLAHCLCGAQLASADRRSFKAQFAGCSEFVGWGPVSLAAAQLLVPTGYVLREPRMDKRLSSFGPRAARL